jgi:hypothetical protein
VIIPSLTTAASNPVIAGSPPAGSTSRQAR